MRDLHVVYTLYDYNDWANSLLLTHAARLDAAAYTRDFGAAWRSVRGTLTHLFEVDRLWLRRWQGQEAHLPRDPDAFDSIEALRAAWDGIMSEREVFLKQLAPEDLDKAVPYTNLRGQAYSEPLWQLLFHVVNHGTDHRGYLSVMLTELGEPPPELDFIFWVRGYNWRPDGIEP